MTGRTHDMAVFLTLSGWAEAKRVPLAGDASNRRYERLTHPRHGHAVLMDAPPETGEDTRPFIKIATHLHAAGLSAPQIYARDTERGFLIIEDLGDDLFAKVLDPSPAQELALYLAAADALFHAQQVAPPKDLARYGPAEMADTAMLAVDWYLKFTTPGPEGIRLDLLREISAKLATYLTGPEVLVQRDYHAENLLWLPDRKAPANVGLLDFQDAMLGHPAYDLASLLKDARRDVAPAVQQAAIDRFLNLSGVDPDQFMSAYATCSAQRNLRILGVFTRLCVRDDKRHYPDLLPRVWRNLMSDLEHPALYALRPLVVNNFPEPSPQLIATLKAANV